MVATYTTDPTFEVESLERLHPASNSVVQYGLGVYDVSSDDERFVVIRLGGLGSDDRLILVQNFFEELEQHVRN